MFDSMSNKSLDVQPQCPAWNGITCINPRAPALLVALGSRSGFSVRSTPTRSVAPIPDRFPSRTNAVAMRFARFASDVRDCNITAMRSSSFVDTTPEPGKLRSPSIKSRISLSEGGVATTTAPGSRKSAVFFEIEVVTGDREPTAAPANEIVARAAAVVIPIETSLSLFLTVSPTPCVVLCSSTYSHFSSSQSSTRFITLEGTAIRCLFVSTPMSAGVSTPIATRRSSSPLNE